MKLLVIVLCLLSERYLVHVSAHHRFSWFHNYLKMMGQRLPSQGLPAFPWLTLLMLVAPAAIVTWGVLYVFSGWIFGLVGLIFNIAIFYYCLGPGNPFYPVRAEQHDPKIPESVGDYLVQVNGQLFAVIFWYIALGPIGILVYRLISLCQTEELVHKEAALITAALDWIPAKLTSLLYLLVGNFQAGFKHFVKFIFAAPQENNNMLSTCGLSAVGTHEEETFLMPQAEILVEHAVIVLLVLLALFTMASFL